MKTVYPTTNKVCGGGGGGGGGPDGPWLYYKLTNEPKGSGELKTKVSRENSIPHHKQSLALIGGYNYDPILNYRSTVLFFTVVFSYLNLDKQKYV